MQELEPWVIEELSAADFGDQRLTKCFMRLVSDLAGRPEATGHKRAPVQQRPKEPTGFGTMNR